MSKKGKCFRMSGHELKVYVGYALAGSIIVIAVMLNLIVQNVIILMFMAHALFSL